MPIQDQPRTRSRRALLVAAVLLLAPKAAPAQETSTVGNLDLYFGGKTLNNSEWAPADHEGVVGMEMDIKDARWPISIEVGIQGASGRGSSGGVTTTSRTSEMYFGARKIWEPAPLVRPYIDVGLSLVNAQLEESSPGSETTETDSAGGIWFGGGVYWTLQECVNLGLGIRFEGAQVNLFDVNRNAGGAELNFSIGYHWGGRGAA